MTPQKSRELGYGAPAMATLEVEHTFNCSEATFWDQIFLDPEYNERLFKTELKFPVRRESSRAGCGGVLEGSLW